MPSPFAKALLAAQEVFAEEAGESVSIVRSGNPTTTDVEAVPGKKDEEALNYDGVTRVVRSQNFLIKVADYQINSVAVKPAKFDQIIWVNNGVTLTFTAQPDGQDDAVFEYTDCYRTHYRIFCKLTDEA